MPIHNSNSKYKTTVSKDDDNILAWQISRSNGKSNSNCYEYEKCLKTKSKEYCKSIYDKYNKCYKS